MRFTKRLLDRYSLAASIVLISGSAAASCSSTDAGEAPTDAGADSAPVESDAASDSGLSDSPSRDSAAVMEGGPRPVVCGSKPCATALVTTLPLSELDRDEGYCALLDDGAVACWGANAAGQLGRGEDASADGDPAAARVLGLSGIEQLSHTCAVDGDGTVWCWGTGPFLRNDAGARTTERSPVRLPLEPVRQVSIGMDVGCASSESGLSCWGRNTNAQLAPLAEAAASSLLSPRSIALPDGAAIREVLVSKATFVLREDGTVVSWGANPPLGRLSSFRPDPYPLPGALSNVVAMDVATDSACAATGGIGFCWGTVVGASTPLDRALPEPVVAPEPLVQITTTIRSQRWCGIGASGAVYCWGLNANGQAGDGTKDHAYAAVKVELPTTAAGVKAMTYSTCALLTDGRIYCWGSNYYGQLGNRKMRAPALVPEEVVLP